MIELSLPWSDRAVILVRFEERETVEALLTENELEESRTFRLEKRQREWQLARAAAKQLALRVGAADDPLRVAVARPRLVVDGVEAPWFISLSHSANHAAAICGNAPVGIDVQAVRTVRESAAHLFLTGAEADAMRGCNLPDRLLHFWCAKEAAWKQRSPEFATLRQVPLKLEHEGEHGLQFDLVETFRREDVIVAITR